MMYIFLRMSALTRAESRWKPVDLDFLSTPEDEGSVERLETQEVMESSHMDGWVDQLGTGLNWSANKQRIQLSSHLSAL